jgi:hypothetical protein
MLDPKHSDVLLTTPHAVEVPDNIHDFRTAFDAAVDNGDEVTLMAYKPLLQAVESRAFVTDEEKEAAGQFIVQCQVLELMNGPLPRGTMLRALAVRYSGALYRLTLSETSQWLGNN